MAKILLIDTNYSAAPIYDFLTLSGHEVFVCGGNPVDFLAKSVSNYIPLDYSDIEKTRDLIKELNIGFIVPGCNDLSYKVAVELNSDDRYPGLDTPEVTETINNKEKFRTFCARSGLPAPRIIPFEEATEVGPIIVKPVDAYSGRGITIIPHAAENSLAEAIRIAKQYSRTQTCLIEQYVPGQLYSHTTFLRDGTLQADFIVEEHGSANPFVVDTSRVISDFAPPLLQRIRRDILRMAESLGLVDGLIHTQFIAVEDRYWIIEVTRRCPGDLYAELIERATGYPYAQQYAAPFVDLQVTVKAQSPTPSWVFRHTISTPTQRTFRSVQFNTSIQIDKIVPLSLAGDSVSASPFGRIGLMFARAASEPELSRLFQMALARTLYTLH